VKGFFIRALGGYSVVAFLGASFTYDLMSALLCLSADFTGDD
jgi:hypothetical protein